MPNPSNQAPGDSSNPGRSSWPYGLMLLTGTFSYDAGVRKAVRKKLPWSLLFFAAVLGSGSLKAAAPGWGLEYLPAAAWALLVFFGARNFRHVLETADELQVRIYLEAIAVTLAALWGMLGCAVLVFLVAAPALDPVWTVFWIMAASIVVFRLALVAAARRFQ